MVTALRNEVKIPGLFGKAGELSVTVGRNCFAEEAMVHKYPSNAILFHSTTSLSLYGTGWLPRCARPQGNVTCSFSVQYVSIQSLENV